MFHTCAVRFDVTENLEKFLIFWVNSTSPTLNTYAIIIVTSIRGKASTNLFIAK